MKGGLHRSVNGARHDERWRPIEPAVTKLEEHHRGDPRLAHGYFRPSATPWSLAFAPNGTLAAGFEDGHVRFYGEKGFAELGALDAAPGRLALQARDRPTAV